MGWDRLLKRFGKQDAPQSAVSDTAGTRSSFDVVVVGGGIAGLACARSLGRNGKRVLLLEARPRLGGRIHTTTVHGAKVDLGASWIHGGKKHNPIRQLADQAGAKLVRTDFESLELYDIDGRELKGREHDAIDTAVERTMGDLLRAKRSAARDASIEPVVRKALEQGGLSPTEHRGLRWALASEIAMNYASDFDDLSLSQWEEDEEYGGGDYQFAGGCSVLVDFLEKECRSAGVDLRTGAVVGSIDWSSNDVVVDASGQRHQAKQVVVTLPLGVLKSASVVFRGSFPDSKRRAIERLGIGTLNKVVMVFREQFWEEEAAYFGCLGEANELPIDYWNLEHVTDEPILAAIVGAKAATKIESTSDADALRTVLQPLRRVFGREAGEPVAMQVTRWASDPFSRGAYSHVSPGSSYDDYNVLAEPIANRVFFAGEATSEYYPSTLHGAYESGERAAKQVLR